MGFTAGIYKTKRYDDKLTPTDYCEINSFLNSSFYEGKKFDLTEEQKSFFINQSHPQEYSSSFTIFDELESWCSNAQTFENWMNEELGGSTNGYTKNKEISKEIAVKCLNYCNEELEKYKRVPVIAKYAFTEKEDGTITMIPCDGVEVEDEDGRIKRIYTDNFEYTELSAAYDKCDEWAENALISLRDCMRKIIDTVDFDNEIVIYESGW